MRETIGVLGLQWGPKDTLSYNREIVWNEKNTKRSVLAFTNGMFDPLNRLIPIAIQCRIFLRTLWSMKLDWDQSFDHLTELKDNYTYLRKQVVEGLKHSFDAEVVVLPNSEIHVFGDASAAAYGAVLYIVTPPSVDCLEGKVCFLISKGKLTPPLSSQKSQEDSIPRWELLSLLIAGKLVNFVKKDIETVKLSHLYMGRQ